LKDPFDTIYVLWIRPLRLLGPLKIFEPDKGGALTPKPTLSIKFQVFYQCLLLLHGQHTKRAMGFEPAYLSFTYWVTYPNWLKRNFWIAESRLN
jgi:hypothetical protein